MEGLSNAEKSEVSLGEVVRRLQIYKNMLEQPLDEDETETETETETDRELLAGEYYNKNIATLNCSAFQLNTAHFMVFG